MKKNTPTVLLADRNIHTSVFCRFLSHNTGLAVSHVSCERDWLQVLGGGHMQGVGDELLIVIDLSDLPHFPYDNVFNEVDKQYRNWGCVLVNVPRNMINKELVLNWPNCRGIFRVDANQVELTAGFEKILDGEFWLPRKIMAELIGYYRNESENIEKSEEVHKVIHPSFTSREEDILKLLAAGSAISNAEIAETLFVSENTIKSHLYNMFKKIHVKNRSQARVWARENFLN